MKRYPALHQGNYCADGAKIGGGCAAARPVHLKNGTQHRPGGDQVTIDSTYRRRRISVFDATLRDGEQAPGNAMSPEQKLPLALAAQAYGVDIVEAGFPGSSPADAEATRLIADSLTTARFATFNPASTSDRRASP